MMTLKHTTKQCLLILIVAQLLSLHISTIHAQQVIGFDLIQGFTSTVVTSLVNGTIITIPPGTQPDYGIRANTIGSPITSVLFGLNNVTRFRSETSPPYALCGNDGPIFFGCRRLVMGLNNVTATISNTNQKLVVQFTIVYNSSVPTIPTVPVPSPIIAVPSSQTPIQAPIQNTASMRLILIYTPNSTEMMELNSNSIIDLALYPTPEFSIKAEPVTSTTPTSAPLIRSVRFLPQNQGETSLPYAYCGNKGIKYNPCPIFSTPNNNVTITVQPYTGLYQSGRELPNIQLSFRIIRSTSVPAATPVSIPVSTTTRIPTKVPTNIVAPVIVQTKQPTNSPTKIPTNRPTMNPTKLPTKSPTKQPTNLPTKIPTTQPTNLPTKIPTTQPTNLPNKIPTTQPTNLPTKIPTTLPSNLPTTAPAKQPTNLPTKLPTTQPTNLPTKIPTTQPTNLPTKIPTTLPVKISTSTPTAQPVKAPTKLPTQQPIMLATNFPTKRPTTIPTNIPISSNTTDPSVTLTLIYTPNNTAIGPIVDGMIIDASRYEQLSFNILADSSSPSIKSILFLPSTQRESSKPWAYCGNNGDQFLTCDDFVSSGNYTVTARPYSERQQTGVQYPDVTVRFSIVGNIVPAIEFPKRINCGGPTVSDSKRQTWTADSYFSSGSTYSISSVDILQTEDDIIYRSERYGNFVYNIPVPIGSYSVVLHFAELFHSRIGQRVFDVEVEGTLIADIDIIERAGGRNKTAVTIDTPVIVEDGFVTIRGLTNVPRIDNAKISAIEVLVIGPHYAHAVTGGPYTIVDADSSGLESVPVDGSESHTHGPNEILTTYVWKRGNTIIGTGENTTLSLPAGKHVISLTVTDTSGDQNTDTTIIEVLTSDFPSLTSITPDRGLLSGGTSVTLTGFGLDNVIAIKFGIIELSRTSFTIVNSTTIKTIAPFSGVSVPAAVSVINTFGESNAVTYTYLSNVPIRFNVKRLLPMEDPTAVAFGPDSKLYVGTLSGQLGRFTLNDKYDQILDSTITTIDATRGIHGIAFDPTEDNANTIHPTIYISTSKIFHNEARNSIGDAINGKIQAVQGANMEIVKNIVTGLPVSGLDHSVNGIYFGNNGELYIAIGSNTNGGIPGELTRTLLMRESYFSAAIVVANNIKHPNFNGTITYNTPNDGDPITGIGPYGVEVFASGTRNPYGVVMHSNGKIYATDNGPNGGFGDMATGCGSGQFTPDVYDFDELNLIERGNYYGHPNHKRASAMNDQRQCVWRGTKVPSAPNVVTAPIMKLRSSSDGIIEYEANHFNGELRHNLIVSKYKDGLFRIALLPDGASVAPYSIPAIDLGYGDNGLAVTQAPNGNLIDARYETGDCYTYQPDEPSTTLLTIYSVFPRRGRMEGGSRLSIYGANFDTTISVTIGTLNCPVVQYISSYHITCQLPPSSVAEQKTIVLIKGSNNNEQTEYVNGYRYVLGRSI